MKKYQGYVLFFALYVVIAGINSVSAFDRSVFYRVSSFWDEARLEWPGLSSFHLKISGGHTNEARNDCTDREDLLCLFVSSGYCDHCFPPVFDEDNPLLGIFDILETDINLWQNMACGLFWHFHLPVIATDLFNTSVVIWPDRHPSHDPCLSILEQQCPQKLSQPIHKRGVGDASLFFGITHNYENTIFWDFVDGTFELGVLFPTAQKKDLTQLFDIPYGYNGHWGLTWTARCAVGAYEWLTMGLGLDGVFLFSRTEVSCRSPRRFKIDPGTVIRGGGYLRLDRIVYGISGLFAFNYERKGADRFHTRSAEVFCASALMRQRWSRTMFHLLLESDFTRDSCWFGPLVAIGYNAQLRGRNVFKTNMVEGRFFFDMVWYF